MASLYYNKCNLERNLFHKNEYNMRKSTKPLQNLQGFCKKLQKIIKTVKNILPDTLVCFTIVKDKGVREKQMAQVICFFIPKRVEKTAGGWIAVFGQIVGQGRF